MLNDDATECELRRRAAPTAETEETAKERGNRRRVARRRRPRLLQIHRLLLLLIPLPPPLNRTASVRPRSRPRSQQGWGDGVKLCASPIGWLLEMERN